MRKIISISILSFIGLIVLGGALELMGVKWMGFIEPKRQNVQRQVFENTQSYVHGKTQDLAKYYEQYQKAENIADKEAIASLIKIQMADIESANINDLTLRSFLVNIRGF